MLQVDSCQLLEPRVVKYLWNGAVSWWIAYGQADSAMLGGHVVDGQLPERIPQESHLWAVEMLRLEEQQVKVVVAIAPCCCVKVKIKIWCTHRFPADTLALAPRKLGSKSMHSVTRPVARQTTLVSPTWRVLLSAPNKDAVTQPRLTNVPYLSNLKNLTTEL